MKKSFLFVCLLALTLFSGGITLVSEIPVRNWQLISQQWESENTIHVTYVTPSNDIGSIGEVVIMPAGNMILPVFILYPSEFWG